MSKDIQRTKWRRNIAENFNRLSRVHERQIDRQTDGRQHIANVSEREREYTFAKTGVKHSFLSRVAVADALNSVASLISLIQQGVSVAAAAKREEETALLLGPILALSTAVFMILFGGRG